MSEWMKLIQKAIEQTRNNNKTKASVAGGAALNPSNSVANTRSATGSKPSPKSAEVAAKDKKAAAGAEPDENKAKKRLSGADADKGAENKENNKDWTAPEERKAKSSESSLRRRKPGAGGRTTEDEAVDTDNAKNFYSLQRKKPEAVPTPTGSLGRKSNPKTTKPGSEETQSSKMGGKSKEIGKKRKADDEGLEDGGDVAMEVPDAAGQLESVTKNRVRGPAGRRMPQHRRTHLMKHRASSLSALAHTTADVGNPDNPTNRSAMVLPSHPDPRSTSADDTSSRLSSSLADGQSRSSRSSSRAIEDKADFKPSQNGVDSMNCVTGTGEDVITEDVTEDCENDESKNDALVLSGGSEENGISQVGGDPLTNGSVVEQGNNKDKVPTPLVTINASEANEDNLTDISLRKMDDDATECLGRDAEVSVDAGLSNPIPCEPTNNVGSDCLACKLCMKCHLDANCFKNEENNDEDSNDPLETEPNAPSNLEEKIPEVTDEGTELDAAAELADGNVEENMCRSCNEVLKSEPVLECSNLKAANAPVEENDSQCSVSLRSIDLEESAKNSNPNLRPSTQIETVEMDTFDDIDDALFFRPPTMYGSPPDENGNEGGILKAKKDKPGKSKSKKRVTLDDLSAAKTLKARAPSDAKSKLSRFRKTLTSFRRVRLKTEGNLVDSHPDECGNTRGTFCTIL